MSHPVRIPRRPARAWMTACTPLVLLAAWLPALAQTPPDAALEAQIRALDAAHAAAIFAGDAGALDVLMHDEVTVNHPTGRIVREKRELLDLIAQGVIRYTTFERTPERVLAYPGLVVVMGGEVVVPAEGAPNAGRRLERRYTNAWMRQDDGTWKLSFRHANNVCPPALAAAPER
jgi:ketosteroid isomerase-like protein